MMMMLSCRIPLTNLKGCETSTVADSLVSPNVPQHSPQLASTSNTYDNKTIKEIARQLSYENFSVFVCQVILGGG